MSNFQTFGYVTGGMQGTNPAIFTAVTVDTLAAIQVVGYLNDLGDKVKANDVFFVNYLDTSTFPLGEVSQFAMMRVVGDVTTNLSLVPYSFNSGLRVQKFNYAGGSATATIPDAAVTAAMVVLAVIESSANPVAIEKVTPGAGQVTVLMSADPGASVINYVVFPNLV